MSTPSECIAKLVDKTDRRCQVVDDDSVEMSLMAVKQPVLEEMMLVATRLYDHSSKSV